MGAFTPSLKKKFCVLFNVYYKYIMLSGYDKESKYLKKEVKKKNPTKCNL